ncbi:hypothetical protein KIN20_027372 [Parelaphostrongylus tenuis]|uniref:Uncharacterized protein n=1 Tax=Parelaphostrongylus tenuis TaxID=148309 RepID=A0AAD5WDU0_PARTN|nr:hypothetical protein KIN20_027372 [Parelaphostrongylus tenuis]
MVLGLYFGLAASPKLVGSPAEDPSPKPILWKRYHEDLKKPLQGYARKPRNVVRTASNIPFGLCAGVRTTSEDGPSKYLTRLFTILWRARWEQFECVAGDLVTLKDTELDRSEHESASTYPDIEPEAQNSAGQLADLLLNPGEERFVISGKDSEEGGKKDESDELCEKCSDSTKHGTSAKTSTVRN